MFCVDASEILFGEVDSVEVAISTDASYIDENSNTRHTFTRDQTLVRVILRHDLVLKHPEAVAVINTITWGA